VLSWYLPLEGFHFLCSALCAPMGCFCFFSALVFVLGALRGCECQTIDSATISSGTIFLDDKGDEVHMHGLGALPPGSHPQEDDASGRPKYYFVGSTAKRQHFGADGSVFWLSQGVNLYSTYDLMEWHLEGMVFENTSITTPIPPGEPEKSVYRIERPKLVYDPAQRLYVLFFHLDTSHFKLGMVGVATSLSIAGTYEFKGGFQPDGQRSLDMTIFQDADRLFVARSVNNLYAGISELTSDYINTTTAGVFTKGPRCEGIALWKDYDEKGYYMLGSHLSGWNANPAIMSYSKGATLRETTTWEVQGNPSGSKTTFNSQSTFVFKVGNRKGKVDDPLFIFMADRWNFQGKGSVGNATYIWLPMYREKTTGKFVIDGLDQNDGNGEWKVSDYL
jgi:hypothetical protein